MLIIGERINSTRKHIHEAIKNRDAGFIAREARLQWEAGAAYIDINCAVTAHDELQDIDWAISVIQSEIPDVSICIDSPSSIAIERALRVFKGSGAIIINSITGEKGRIERIVPLAVAYKTRLIALTMDESGMPATAGERRDLAARILDDAVRRGMDPALLYFDPLIRPVSTEPDQGRAFLEAIPLIKRLGTAGTVCGLSNISYGLPRRSAINAAFLAMAMRAGLDAAILDPLDKHIATSLRASAAILGSDAFCGAYIQAFREGKLL